MLNYGAIHILLVDDEESIRRLAEKEIANPRRAVRTAGSAKQAFDLIRRHQFDVILLDIRLPDGDGLELLEQFRETVPDVEVILITGHGNIDSAVQAMKMGAYDYITKPFQLERLELVIEKAYQRVCLQRENRLLRHTQNSHPPSLFIGASPAVREIHFLLEKVAPTNAPVLITGESGSGKDVAARSVHMRSSRADQPLIIKNCGTLQRELMLSELFGHRKGSFTGAVESREGLLSLANRGTLFLDEIGELPPDVQASLLRVLETQTYRRVGEKEEKQVDIRFLFATHRNLVEEVKSGRFHEALYHRVNVFHIEIPPLRGRKEDIPLLVEHFLGVLCAGRPLCRVSKAVMQRLLSYDWPGNVRELRNVIERGIILSEDGFITPRALPLNLSADCDEPPVEDERFLPLVEMEKRHILRVMHSVDGNRSQASEVLGIGRKTLYRKLKEFGID